MKKLLLFFLSLWISMASWAQFKEFGLSLGGNISTVTGNVSNQKMNAGLVTGAYGAYELSDKFLVQLDLEFSQLGASFENSDLQMDYDVTLNYIQIPLSFKYKFDQRFGVQAGGYFSFMAGDNASGDLGGESFTPQIHARGSDGGLRFGVFFNTYENLRFQLIFQQGLGNIHDNPEPNSGTALNGYKNCTDALKVWNQSIQLTISYAFKNF